MDDTLYGILGSRGLAGILGQEPAPLTHNPNIMAQGILARGLPRMGQVFGFPMRQPYPGEADYFRQNPNVSGMAADDMAVTLNPYSGLTQQQRNAVAKNEAARLFMRDKKLNFDFDITPEQRQYFSGTPYEKDDYAMASTILARAVSGDPSAGQLTQRQREWADWLLQQLSR